MLVESSRLRPGDLEYWRVQELDDLLRARRCARRLQRMAVGAREAIRAFMELGPTYVSVSWGKDSIVALDLALSVRPDLLVIHIVQGSAANPDDMLVRDAAHERWALRYVEIDCPRDEEYVWSTWTRQIKEAERHGGRIMGIRASESSIRRMSASVHGISTARVCRPILWWEQADVWAWLALRDLPVHPVYAMTAGGSYPRDSLRVAGLMDVDQPESDGSGLGRAEWERMYYGSEMLRRFMAWHGRDDGSQEGKMTRG